MELQTQVPKLSLGIKNQEGLEKTMQQMIPKYFLVFFLPKPTFIYHTDLQEVHLLERRGRACCACGACGMWVSRWARFSAVLLWNMVLVSEEGWPCCLGAITTECCCQAAALHILLPWQPVPFCILWWMQAVYESMEEVGFYIKWIPGGVPGTWSRERLCACTGRVAGAGYLFSALKSGMIWNGSCGSSDTCL